MLTGEPPYRSAEAVASVDSATSLEDKLAVYADSIRRAPRPTAHRRVPGVDRELASIIDRCLVANPDRRFNNAQAVLDALDARARRQAQTPLVVFGAVGPIVLLAVMAVFALLTYQTA